jgi:hypothetical protein
MLITQTKEVVMSCFRFSDLWEEGYIVFCSYGGCYTGQRARSKFIITSVDDDLVDLLELKRTEPEELTAVSVEDLAFVTGLFPLKPETNTIVRRDSVRFVRDVHGNMVMPPEYVTALNRAGMWLD